MGILFGSPRFIALQEWIDYFDRFWVSKLQKLETLLNEKLQKIAKIENLCKRGKV
ncbi:MAG TPA: hypothetical protein VGD31_12080 [Sphingobacteriaceae bacterium]